MIKNTERKRRKYEGTKETKKRGNEGKKICWIELQIFSLIARRFVSVIRERNI